MEDFRENLEIVTKKGYQKLTGENSILVALIMGNLEMLEIPLRRYSITGFRLDYDDNLGETRVL